MCLTFMWILFLPCRTACNLACQCYHMTPGQSIPEKHFHNHWKSTHILRPNFSHEWIWLTVVWDEHEVDSCVVEQHELWEVGPGYDDIDYGKRIDVYRRWNEEIPSKWYFYHVSMGIGNQDCKYLYNYPHTRAAEMGIAQCNSESIVGWLYGTWLWLSRVEFGVVWQDVVSNQRRTETNWWRTCLSDSS